MSFDWAKFLDFAKEMAKQMPNADSPQAWARSAISRAYYAAYHNAYAH
jgi:hypothetical protein